MNHLREKVVKAHRALLNGTGELAYFEGRGIAKRVVRDAFVGYESGAFLYPCRARSGGLLGLHYKSKARDGRGKRRQWWQGYADLPPKGHGKKPDDPAKIIPFGLETLEGLEPGSPVVLFCGEEDAMSARQAGYVAVSQPGAGLLEPVYAREFAGLDVIVFYDAGEEQDAHKDALKLVDAGAGSVRVVRWPDEAPNGADVNGRLVEDPEGFAGWLAEMIEAAQPVHLFGAEEGPTRDGAPDDYRANAGRRSRDGARAEWEDPAPLPDGLPPVAPFDPALLPDPLRPWCTDIAKRMQVPLDYVAVGAVTVAASLIGRKVGIHPKRRDDWLVVPNLWAGIVGPPSAMKSPALAEVTKPLDRLVAEAMKVHSEAEEAHEARAEAVEAEKAALKKAIDAAAKKSVETGDRSRLDELIDRRRSMEVPEPPTERRYKTSDTTIEKLVEILRDNPTGILVQRDELTGWLRSLDKQGREVDRAFYLESWNGTGSYTVDRIGRGTLHVEAVCISVLGGIQPGPLRSYVHHATKGGEGADGLLQRFQLLVWPDPPKGTWRNVDRYPDAGVKNRAYAVYEALDGLEPGRVGAEETEPGAPIPALRFSPDAQEMFDQWRHELEAKLRDEELSEILVSHLAKYRSLMPSLAVVFHLMDPAGPSVGVASAARAAAWCEYLEGHARRVYASGESPALEGARALLAHIRKGDVKDGDTVRSVYRGRHWSRLSAADEVNAAAIVLEDYGWLRTEKLDTGGRPTYRLRLHPELKGKA